VKPGKSRGFDSHWLQRRLATLLPPGPAQPRYCVAWSAGLDSTALLAALVELRAAARRDGKPVFGLRAIHVDHHLQEASQAFREFCIATARRLRVPLAVLDLQLRPRRGESVEQVARDARYAALAAVLRPGELLLTAQHETDQLETVLLQLLRGAGVAGLKAMAESQPFARGCLLRPLLAVDREALRAYAQEQRLSWIDDPSNQELRFDRNYLRACVLPPLLQRWPSAAQTVARSARLAAEVNVLLQRQARSDCDAAADGEALDLQVARRLAPARLRAALRWWIGARGLPLPDERRLQQVVAMIRLRADASPCVQWSGACIRRHQDRLLAAAEPRSERREMSSLMWQWSRVSRLELPQGLGSLQLRADPHGDVDLARLPRVLAVRLPTGGERLLQKAGHRDVKDLLREAGVPSWERLRVPLLFAPPDSRQTSPRKATARRSTATSLLAIGDLELAQGLRCGPATRRRGRFIWQRE